MGCAIRVSSRPKSLCKRLLNQIFRRVGILGYARDKAVKPVVELQIQLFKKRLLFLSHNKSPYLWIEGTFYPIMSLSVPNVTAFYNFIDRLFLFPMSKIPPAGLKPIFILWDGNGGSPGAPALAILSLIL